MPVNQEGQFEVGTQAAIDAQRRNQERGGVTPKQEVLPGSSGTDVANRMAVLGIQSRAHSIKLADALPEILPGPGEETTHFQLLRMSRQCHATRMLRLEAATVLSVATQGGIIRDLMETDKTMLRSVAVAKIAVAAPPAPKKPKPKGTKRAQNSGSVIEAISGRSFTPQPTIVHDVAQVINPRDLGV